MAHPPARAYVVASPRISDAIGVSLRDAFRKDGLPSDMQGLLRVLDTYGEVGRDH